MHKDQTTGSQMQKATSAFQFLKCGMNNGEG
jgi:hypothetical protein